MKKSVYNVKPAKYGAVLKWAKSKQPHEDNPIIIPHLGGRGNTRLWVFDSILLIKPQSDGKRGYILDKEKWNAFLAFWAGLTPEQKNNEDQYIALHYKDAGVTDFTYWPVVLAISKEYEKDNQRR